MTTKAKLLPSATPSRLMHDKPIALRMLPSERDELMAAARRENRSASNFALVMFRHAFADYKAQQGKR